MTNTHTGGTMHEMSAINRQGVCRDLPSITAGVVSKFIVNNTQFMSRFVKHLQLGKLETFLTHSIHDGHKDKVYPLLTSCLLKSLNEL